MKASTCLIEVLLTCSLAAAVNVSLGVCYYPEQWSQDLWSSDATRMQSLGLRYVRLAEFSWALLEPSSGNYNWGWLDESLKVLDSQGLKAVLGTPTATPPKWLIDQYPDILPVDINNRTRKFGSRRHYTFSSQNYIAATTEIVTQMAKRYGTHPAVAGWQIDNELGCHDTVRSYSPVDKVAFQKWLAAKYADVDALNKAWGTVFWSEIYSSFEEVELPNLAVTESNPSAWLDFYRFSSDQVVAYTQLQASILRQYSPERFITTNMMGFFTDYDHYAVADLLDFTSWDNYPLGFLATSPFPPEVQQAFEVTGHPDISAFHHDLYRGMSKSGDFWVMEQQPGPVNWAPYNPSPAIGMVRLWTWEAFSHGAQVVSYFRWRQSLFAQEQMHSGLNRPDNVPDVAYVESLQVVGELKGLGSVPPLSPASVAIVFDYEALWVIGIQPQGQSFQYLPLVFLFYSTLRQLGLNVDIVRPGAPLSQYSLVVVPSLPIVSEAALKEFAAFKGTLVFGPRTGSKTADFQIPPNLPPGNLQSVLPLKVTRVSSWSPSTQIPFYWQDNIYTAAFWTEQVFTQTAKIVASYADASGAILQANNSYYLTFYPSTDPFLITFLASLCQQSGIKTQTTLINTPLRVQQRGPWTFVFNFSPQNVQAPAPPGSEFVIGGAMVGPYGVSAWVNASSEVALDEI